ncbi:serine/threonine protein kinase [Gimesia aquarii]|uniref:Serine/threonine-protein kinase PknB n=1 Tax=Gimesia aquarii TaxID=2527964 RepID=A0A517WUS5_9PLAN|nr:serine/threonine-protein kinase [Gimesia aquarii]QDU09013.1 Serine/threonine-protein kinase PknB [Gimesia aquarii]
MDSESQNTTGLSAELSTADISLETLASQFLDEYRQWLNPSIEDYAIAYPEYAEAIRESFPVLITMEQWKGNREYSRLLYPLPDEFNLKQLGDCRFIREISRNKTSISYEAIQGGSNRRVAVKLLPWKSKTIPRWRDRFKLEARLASRLKHQNIVSLYHSGEDQGYCYAILQLVNGVRLDQIIQYLSDENKEIPHDEQTEAVALTLTQNKWNTFAGIGLQIAKALQYSHGRGILHYNINPENILLNCEGQSWLANFTLPQFAEGVLKQQSAKVLLYQAPERFKDQHNEQSDLYSLGMVMYELATLTPAFETHKRSQLANHIIHNEVLRPRKRNAKIPVDFETIILNCIAKSQQTRYQSAKELSLDLVRFINGKSIKRRTRSHDSTNKKWSEFCDKKWFEFWKKN